MAEGSFLTLLLFGFFHANRPAPCAALQKLLALNPDPKKKTVKNELSFS